MKTLFMTLLLILNVQLSFAAKQCSDYLTDTRFEYATTWQSKKNINQKSQHQTNGLLIELVTELFIANKRLPTTNELEAALILKFNGDTSGYIEQILKTGLTKYFKTDGAPKSVSDILQTAIAARKAKFAPYYTDLKNDVMTFFSLRLRAPTLNELATLKNLDKETLSLFITDKDKFIKKAMDENSVIVSKARELILNTYFRALSQKDLPEAHRTQASSPTIESLFVTLMAMKIPNELKKDIESNRFTKEHLATLIGLNSEASNQAFRIQLFSSMSEVETTARRLRPTAFKNFIPAEIYNPENLSALYDAVTKKKGFLATSVNAGIPINEAMFISMLKYAKDKDYDIVVFPTGGILDGIDPRLMENPNIHIVTHTVQNAFLKIWNIPILPKNQNALASLNNPKQHKPMQTIIVGHPAIQHMNVPTATNHLRATAIWSTGSLSQNYYPYRVAVQGRTGNLAKNQHTNGFLVVEKADGESGFNKEGVPNFWHVRPIYFSEDFKETGTAGFIDNGVEYKVHENDKYSLKDVVKTSARIDTIVLGDLHEHVTDLVFLKTLTDFIKSHPEIKRVVLHDPIDGSSHNRHETKSLALLKQKFANGELDYHKEMMALVQVVNARPLILT